MSFALDCLLTSYLLLASLTIWCAQATSTVFTVQTGPVPAHGPRPPGFRPAQALLRIVEPSLASLPHALGSLAWAFVNPSVQLTVGQSRFREN